MNIELCMEDLRREEGYSRWCYYDSVGAHTVGHGRNISKGGIGISEGEADFLLKNDVLRSLKECEKFSWFNELNNTRKSVLVQLCFQLGYPKLTHFTKVLTFISQQNFNEAAEELFPNSKFAIQCPARAKRLAEQIKKG